MSDKVAFFIRAMHGGGAQRAMVRLASGFAGAGYTVEVLTLDPEGGFRAELSPEIKVIPMRAKRIWQAVPELAAYLRRERPAAMLVTEPACNIAVIIAKLLSRVSSRVLIREGLFPSVAVTESPHRATRIAYRLAPFLYPHAQVIVSLAATMTEDLARFTRIPAERITTIPINPVVTSALLEQARVKPEHPWFSSGVPAILGVGRLDRQKDFATLITAFDQVRQTREARLVIIGDGPLRNDLERQRAQSPFAADIDLAGFSANPFPAMAACDVFVLSSRYEGQPNVLIEALACGAPVVATDCPSGPSDILQYGRVAPLVPVGDAAKMAEAILARLATPVDRDALRSRGMDFTLEKSTSRYIQALFPTNIRA